MAGTVPVELKLKIEAEINLDITIAGEVQYTIPTTAPINIKAGVSWKKDKDWKRIFDANMDFNILLKINIY